MSLYGAAAAVRRELYARGMLRSASVSVPVVSVGNLTWGGTGKTPLLAFLAGDQERRGRRVGIVARGYGRRSRGVVVVSDGANRLADLAAAGDEPSQLSARFPRAIVVVGEERAAAARRAADLGAEILLLDDAFQHLALRRDLDIVLVDAASPFGGGTPPFGRAREDPSALSRADLIVVTRDDGNGPSAADAAVERWSRAPVFHCRFCFSGWRDAEGSAELPPGRPLAFCAIGNPGSFRATLSDAGTEATGFATFRDHHAYSEADIRRLEERAAREGAAFLVCTEKDFEKVAGRSRLPLFAARIEAQMREPGFADAVESMVAAKRR